MRAYVLTSLLLLLCGACASNMFDNLFGAGEGTGNRAPSSIGEGESISVNTKAFDLDYKTMAPPEKSQSDDATSQEFGPQMRLLNAGNSSTRRQVGPWDSMGPENEGSLWDDSTQGNFYFARDINFKVGDIIVVKVHSDINDILNAKIASLVARQRALASVTQGAAKAGAEALGTKLPEGAKVPQSDKPIVPSANEKFVEVKEIATRIVQVLPGGLLKLQGTERVFIANLPFMLRSIPYQVKFQGMARIDELGLDHSISSEQVLDSKVELTR